MIDGGLQLVLCLYACDCIVGAISQTRTGTDIPEEFMRGKTYTNKEILELMKRFCFITNKKEWRKDRSYRPSRDTKLLCGTCGIGCIVYTPIGNGIIQVVKFEHCHSKCRPVFDERDPGGVLLWSGGEGMYLAPESKNISHLRTNATYINK